MYTMEDFKRKKIIVRVDKDRLEEFLGLCEDEGMLWVSGNKPRECRYWNFRSSGRIFPSNGIVTCPQFDSEGRLAWCNIEDYKCHYDIKIVDMKDFLDHLEPAHHAKYRITIESDGTNTTAHMEINGKQIKSTQSKCHPMDKFNFKTGAEMAFDRLWDSDKEKNKHFCVGDRVVCVGPCINTYIDETDRVPYFIGMHGTVRGIFTEDVNPFFKRVGYAVEFDEECSHGHTCCGCVSSKRGWVCNSSSLRHE